MQAAAAVAAAASVDHHHSHHPMQQQTQQHHHKQHSLIHQPVVLNNQHHNNHHHHHHLSSSINPQSVASTTTSDSGPPSAVEGATRAGAGLPLDDQLPDAERIYHHNNLHHLNTHPNHLSHHHHHTHSMQHNNSCPLNLEQDEEECCLHQQQTPSDSPEASSSGGSSTGEDWESGEFNINNSTLEPHLCTTQQPPVEFIQTVVEEQRADGQRSPPSRSARQLPNIAVGNAAPKSTVRKKTSHKSTKLKPYVGGSALSGAVGLYSTLSSSGSGLLPTSRIIAPQFKAKSSNIRIADGTSTTSTSNGGVGSGALSATNVASRKMRWMSNMRTDPDFRDAFARNVNVVVRPTMPRRAMRATPDDDSQDEVDFYSAVCDTQLSVGTSPCKSPQELMALLAANRSGVIGSGVRPHRLGSGGASSFGASRRNSGGGVDLSGSSSNKTSSWFSTGSDGRASSSANGNYDGSANNCKVLVVAKPVESQLIGFNVVNTAGVGNETLRSVSASPAFATTPEPPNNERLSGVESDTANHPEPAVSTDLPLPKTELELALNAGHANEASGKRPVSWVESRFKHRFFGRSNVVSSAQTKTKANAIPTIPWFGHKSGSAGGGAKRSSFNFREIRQELQTMRQNNRNRSDLTSKSVKATSGLAADIKSKTMKKANNTSSSLPLDVVCEDIAQ